MVDYSSMSIDELRQKLGQNKSNFTTTEKELEKFKVENMLILAELDKRDIRDAWLYLVNRLKASFK